MKSTAHLQEDEGALKQLGPEKRKLCGVVFVVATYLPESYGGAEQHTRKLARVLLLRGIDVTILAPRLSSASLRNENANGLKVRRFRLRRAPNLGGRHFLSFLKWSIDLLLWLYRNRDSYDVIQVVHGRLHALPAALIGTLVRKPVVIKIGRGGTEHFDLDVVSRKRLAGPFFADLIVRNSSCFVANSQEIEEDLVRWNIARNNIHCIPNGVDIPLLPENTSCRKTRTFVCIGRLDQEKAIDQLIIGFAKLGGSSSLTVVGDGDCRASLEQLVDHLALTEHVRFTGAVPNVATILQEADVYVSCSLSEGMSNALLEAMSFGVVPLVSVVSGVLDVVTHGENGFTFPAGDRDAFETQLRLAAELPDHALKEFGRRARQTVIEKFGIDLVADQHVELYERLIA